LNRLAFEYECIVGNRYRSAINISGQVTPQKMNLVVTSSTGTGPVQVDTL